MKKAIISLIIISLAVFIFGCDLLGAGWFLPDFMGSWAIEEVTTDPLPMTSRMLWSFAREEWELWYQFKYEDEDWQSMGANRGTLTSEGGTITMTLTHEKIVDPETWLIADDTEWTAVEDAGSAAVITWSVAGDELTITDSDGEKTVLTRVTDTEAE